MMETFLQIIMVAFIAICTENIVFSRALGSSTMLIAAKNKNQFFSFGLSITYMATASSAIGYFTDKLFLKSESSYMYMPIIYVVVVGLVYTITLVLLWRFAKPLFVLTKKFIHISSFNCAVLGALFLNSQYGNSLLEYLGFGLGTGIGFMLATYLLSIVYDRLFSESIPESFRGIPLVLIYIGILSMAFYGLSGFRFGM